MLDNIFCNAMCGGTFRANAQSIPTLLCRQGELPMAGSLNEVNLIGHVGKDPEIRTMNSGDKVANFSIATSETWKDKSSGEKKERTEWHNIAVWGNLVEIVERYVHKGDKLMIRGQMQTRKWQDKDGADRYSTEVVLRGFDAKLLMLGSKSGEKSDTGGGGGYGGEAKTGSSYSPDLDDDIIPF